jgi:flagellar biogenesis protein FliO
MKCAELGVPRTGPFAGAMRAMGALTGCLGLTIAHAQEAASAPALAFKPVSESTLPGPQQWAVATLACLLALLVAVWWLRKQGGRLHKTWGTRQDRLVVVVERTPITPQTHLLVVDHGDERLLLSVGPAGTQLITRHQRPSVVAAQPSAPSSPPVPQL